MIVSTEIVRTIKIDGQWPSFTLNDYNEIKQALFDNAQEVASCHAEELLETIEAINESDLSDEDKIYAKKDYLTEVMTAVAMAAIEPLDHFATTLANARGVTTVFDSPAAVVGLAESVKAEAIQ